MKFLVLLAIFNFMNIYVFEKCDAKCDQYFVVFQESSCKQYHLRPKKLRDINWDEVTHPCNSTDTNEIIPFNKECFLELDCDLNTQISCYPHVKKTNYQNHSTVPDENTTKPVAINYGELSTSTETTKSVHNKTESKKTIDLENDTSMYDVNIIYINEKNMDSSESITEFNTTNDKIYCDYAETICNKEGKPENYEEEGRNKTAEILRIIINRDQSSPIQPIFTGYFNDDITTHPDSPFKYFKSINITCNILKHYDCKTNISEETSKHVNIYLKTSYVQNNTITKYSNCTNNLTASTTTHSLYLKCNNSDFSKNNKLAFLSPQPNDTSPDKPDNEKEQNKENDDSKVSTFKYDVNLIHINENYIQSDTSTTHIESKTTRDEIYCDFAETVCTDVGNLGHESGTETAKTLQITINRHKNSLIQPIFTGYFNNGTKSQADSAFKDFNTVECNISKSNNCKENVGNRSNNQINVYLKSNYIHNNTITIYPNCTKDLISSTSNNSLNLKCDDIPFAKYNQHILPPQSNKTFEVICQITNMNDSLLSTTERNKNMEINFENCSNHLMDKNESVNKKFRNIYNNATEDNVKIDAINTENIIKFLIAANALNESNCSKNLAINIHKGKIINSGVGNRGEKILKTNVAELQLSNCTNINSIINITQSQPKKELIIFLKEYSSNTTFSSNSKIFNESIKEANDKQKIIIQCDLPNRSDSKNSASDKTVLQCQPIDLEVYNNIPDKENTKEKKKDILNPVQVRNNQIESYKSSNCTTNKTFECNTSGTNNKDNDSNLKVIENKDDKNNKKVQTNAGGKADYRKENFNRRTDITNSAVKDSLSREHNEIEKIMLIAFSSLAGASLLMLVILKLRKIKGSDAAPTTGPANMDETAF